MLDKVDEVTDALKHFLELLEPDDEVMVLMFSDDVRVVQDFTSDRRRVGRVIESIAPVGGTALHDAVIEAVKRVAPAPAESKAVVLVRTGHEFVRPRAFHRATATAMSAHSCSWRGRSGSVRAGGELHLMADNTGGRLPRMG